MNNTLTDVPHLWVGHAQNVEAITGCTVVICEQGAVAGVDQRGGAPGTRETDLLRPMHMVEKVHAVLLGGGSAYGLAAADGVMTYLEEKGIGFDVGVARVPIVPAAILFDLSIGDASVRPDAAMGRAACEAASREAVPQGSVGAGTGASVGGAFGPAFAMKGGIGSASVDLGDGVVVAALIAVNAFGDVIDPETNRIVAGVRTPPEGDSLADTLVAMRGMMQRPLAANTVIGVVATNAKLTKEEANKVAQMAHNGLARTIRPAHTMFDGDTLFALSTGDATVDVSIIGAYAVEVVAQAVINGIQAATSLGGLPAAADWRQT